MDSNVIIKFDKVSIYQNENLILANVSLEVDRGEFVYLIGKTGSGKSSLLKTFYADLEVKNGNATVAGFDLRSLRTKEIPFLRRKLGIVFQDFQLLMDRTVAENLYFIMKATGWKDKREMQRRMHEVLAKVNLETKANSMPHKLSGGEQQRVAIARALAMEPQALLLDEPTAALDPARKTEVVKVLQALAKEGTTMVIVTHEPAVVSGVADRRIVLEAGRIVED